MPPFELSLGIWLERLNAGFAVYEDILIGGGCDTGGASIVGLVGMVGSGAGPERSKRVFIDGIGAEGFCDEICAAESAAAKSPKPLRALSVLVCEGFSLVVVGLVSKNDPPVGMEGDLTAG